MRIQYELRVPVVQALVVRGSFAHLLVSLVLAGMNLLTRSQEHATLITEYSFSYARQSRAFLRPQYRMNIRLEDKHA